MHDEAVGISVVLLGSCAYTAIIIRIGIAAMKTLLLACASIALFSATALACRGTAEYPQISLKLAESNMTPAEKDALARRLNEGEAIHRRGHELDSQELRQESLKILDEIKAKIAR